MIIPVSLLTFLGIVIINSSNQALAIQQTIFLIFGLGLFFLLSSLDFRSLVSVSKVFYLLTLFLLVVVFFIGFETRGSLRWIPLGPFTFQPSEFAKPVIILTLANFWGKNNPTWLNIGKSLFLILPVTV